MIALDNADKIQGDASTAAEVDYTLHGVVGTTVTQLADGQLADATGDLYTAGEAIAVMAIVLVNTGAAARTCNLFLLPSGGTARRIIPKDCSLGIGYSLHTDGVNVRIMTASGQVVQTYSAHKDDHDPEDGADPLDCAAPVKVGSANAEGSSHSLARADHVHEREHAIYVDASAVAAVEAAGLALAEGKAIDLAEALSADGKYCGITCAGVAGETVAYKELVYLKTADQRWWKALADAEATSGDVMVAIVIVGDDAGNAITLLLWGYLREDDFNFTSYGQALFIDASSGGVMTQTAPSGASQIVRVVGYAHDDADTIFFCPSPVWIETAA